MTGIERIKARNFDKESPNLIKVAWLLAITGREVRNREALGFESVYYCQKQRNWERKISEDDDVLFLKCAELPVRYTGLKLVRKMKTLRYKSGHDSYIGTTNKGIKEGDFTGKELQPEKRAK